jgi:hypothetical protein
VSDDRSGGKACKKKGDEQQLHGLWLVSSVTGVV